MTDDSNTPATKADLDTTIEELRTELKNDMNDLRGDLKADMDMLAAQMINHMSEIKDQMLSAFKMTEETIRKEVAYAEEVSAIDTRLKRVEDHIGINEQ